MTKDRYRYFRVEARELLEALGRGVLDLEKAPDDRALVARLLRHAHTLKGAARVVQQESIGRLSHEVEDALGLHRAEGAPPVPRERVDALLRILDEMGRLVNALEPPPPARPEGAPERRVLDESLQSVRVDVRDLDALLASALEAAVQVGGLRRQLAALEHAVEVSRLLSSTLSPRRTDGEAAPGRGRPLADELRRTVLEAHRGMAARVDEVEREIAQLRTFADRLRLLPARTVFGGLERAVRDAARTLDREVAFTATGGEVRVDANVLSAVREALLHVVRNAVAHGIEPADERRRRGKPATGRITLEVERRGRKVAFVCRDDGSGIDVAAVREAALRKGHTLPDGADAPLRPEALTQVLLQGVSTRSSADAVAGRGVGLDVVRDVAARLKADVRFRTERGHGTAVEIEVPVSLTAITALHVDVGGTPVAIPLDAVHETVFVEPDRLTRTAERESIVHAGAALPFVPLASVLGHAPAGDGRRFWSAVILDGGQGLVALGADRLLGTADVVVRPLPAFIEADATVAGATLDAEGQPRLVLDVAGLVARARNARPGPDRAAGQAHAPILVIDDSLTTRMLEQSILESAGYEVEVAVSAEAALEKARSRPFGLFVVDVEMPGMDGFEFVRITRADPRLASIPAILVTSRGAPEDRRRGFDVGASAYIVKSEFDQQRLLDQIAELLA